MPDRAPPASVQAGRAPRGGESLPGPAAGHSARSSDRGSWPREWTAASPFVGAPFHARSSQCSVAASPGRARARPGSCPPACEPIAPYARANWLQSLSDYIANDIFREQTRVPPLRLQRRTVYDDVIQLAAGARNARDRLLSQGSPTLRT